MASNKNEKRREFFRITVSWGIEFGPIMVFFLGAEKLGFLPATAAFVVLTIIAMLVSFIKDRRIALFPLVAGLSVVIFGALALKFHEPFYFMIKDTIYNGGFAVAIAGCFYFYKKPLLKSLFSSLFNMTDRGWTILSYRWMIMFVLLTLSNEIAWRLFSPDAWIKYKMVATFVTLVFGFYQLTLSKKERMPDSNTWGMNIG